MADHQTVTIIFCSCNFGFRKCLGALSWSSQWTHHLWLSERIYCLSLFDQKCIIYILQKPHQTYFKISSLSSRGTYSLSCLSCQFSWDNRILLKCWRSLPKTYLWHTDVGFVQQVFSDAGSQLLADVLYPLRKIWNQHCINHMDHSPLAQLILGTVQEALWLSLNSCIFFFMLKIKSWKKW